MFSTLSAEDTFNTVAPVYDIALCNIGYTGTILCKKLTCHEKVAKHYFVQHTILPDISVIPNRVVLLSRIC